MTEQEEIKIKNTLLTFINSLQEKKKSLIVKSINEILMIRYEQQDNGGRTNIAAS